MHDIDHTFEEMTFEADMENGFEFENDYEWSGENGFEMEDEWGEEYEYEWEMEMEMDDDPPFSESEVMELASELLSVSNEEELDLFLKSLWRKVKKVGKSVFSSKLFKKAGRFLKKIAKKALPIAGGALGSIFGVPGIGASVGKFATRFFEMELEGLSPEDQEFEVAKKYVKFAGTVAKNLSKVPAGAPPQKAVKAAIKSAAKKHAPGLVKAQAATKGRPSAKRTRGYWVRKGRDILIKRVW